MSEAAVTLAEQWGNVPKGTPLSVISEGVDYFQVSHRGRPVCVPKGHVAGLRFGEILDSIRLQRNGQKPVATKSNDKPTAPRRAPVRRSRNQ